MKDKIEGFIIDLLRKNGKIIVPRLGVLLNSGKLNEKVIFNEFIKFNDGILVKQIAQKERMMQNEALQQLDAYVETILETLESGKVYSIEQVGKFSMDDKKKIIFEGFGEIDSIRPKQEAQPKRKGIFGDDAKSPKKLTEAEIKRKEAEEANKKMKEESLKMQAEIEAKAKAILAGKEAAETAKASEDGLQKKQNIAPENKLAVKKVEPVEPAPSPTENIKPNTVEPAEKEIPVVVTPEEIEQVSAIAEQEVSTQENAAEAKAEEEAKLKEKAAAEEKEKEKAAAETARLKAIADAAQRLKESQEAEAQRIKALEEKQKAADQTPPKSEEKPTLASKLGSSLLRNPIKKEEPTVEPKKQEIENKKPDIKPVSTPEIKPAEDPKKEAVTISENKLEKKETKEEQVEVTPVAPTNSNPKTAASNPPKKKKRTALVIFAVVIVLLAASGVAYFLLNNKTENHGESEQASTEVHENDSLTNSAPSNATENVDSNDMASESEVENGSIEETVEEENSFLDETESSADSEKQVAKEEAKPAPKETPKPAEAAKPVAQPKPAPAPTQQTIVGEKYYVIVGSFQFKDFAENQRKKLLDEGFKSAVVVKERNNMFPVSFGVYKNRADAEKMRDEAKAKGYSDAWILKY